MGATQQVMLAQNIASSSSGYAVLFDGANGSYADIGTSTALNPIAITVAVWIKATNFSHTYNAIIGKSGGGYYALYVNSSGKVAVYLSNGPSYDGTGSHTISTGVWTHLAFTYDSTSGLVGYVNGAVDGTSGAAGNISVSGSMRFADDNQGSSPIRFFAGALDDVGIWNFALTSGQIATEMSGGVGSIPSGLVGNWQCDEGFGNTIADTSGSGNNGTLNGGYSWVTGH